MTEKEKSVDIKKENKLKKSVKSKKEIKEKKTLPVKEEVKKEIKPEHYFFLKDGRVLKDVVELAECLESISDDIFFHHVNDSRNDFSNWIRDIFGNIVLSEEIYAIKEPRKVQLIILKHIAKNKK